MFDLYRMFPSNVLELIKIENIYSLSVRKKAGYIFFLGLCASYFYRRGFPFILKSGTRDPNGQESDMTVIDHPHRLAPAA